MGHFISNTTKQQQAMLQESGYESFDDLFAEIPEQVRLKEGLKIPSGRSELEMKQVMEAISEKNQVFAHVFRGAGAYRHYIPSIVKSVTSKEDFLTAYTPYQAEISQGNLQSIFEFQTMICELTGMEAANASVYDGASAAAESVFMCVERKRTKVLVSATTPPEVLGTMKTYCYGRNVELEVVPMKDGVTDQEALASLVSATTACFYLQQPNFYGIVEDAKALGEVAHSVGVKFIMGCNPIALGIMETPGACGADVAVGEGQPLGLSLAFGGPYLGFMAATKGMMRKLPGRIVGETTDSEGKRGFVLTLQAREQHIRREKASSNICSNQALCALTASVYLSTVGANGLEQVATLCMSKAHYLAEQLETVGLKIVYDQPYFHEFVTEYEGSVEALLEFLESKGYLGGLQIADHQILWCATELNTKEEIDTLVSLIGEVQSV